MMHDAKDVIKAMKYCNDPDKIVDGETDRCLSEYCPYYRTEEPDCMDYLMGDALTVILQQKKKIARLKKQANGLKHQLEEAKKNNKNALDI